MIDVFRVGVSLAFSTNGPQIMGVLLRDLGRIHGATDALKSNFERLKTVAIGALGVMAGGAALKGIWDIVKGAGELNRQLTLTKSLNPQFNADIGTIRKDAYRYSSEVGTAAPEDFVKMQREAFTQIPSLMTDKNARDKIMPMLGRLAWQLQQGNGGDQDRAVFDAVKAIDIRGNIFSKGADGKEHVDPDKAAAELNALAQGIKASGYTLTPKDFRIMIAQGGIAAKVLAPDVIYGYMTEAAMTLGASKTGTAMGSLYQQVEGGTVPLHVVREWQKQGFIKEGRDFEVEKGGHVTMNASGRKRMDMPDFDQHLDRWINDFFVKGEQARGLGPKEILQEISRMFGRQTTQRLVAEMVTNGPQFLRTQQMFQSAYSVDQTAGVMNTDSLATSQKGLETAWRGLIDALGEQGIPLAIKVLNDMTAGLHWLSAAAVLHPGWTSALMEAATGIAAMAVTGGSLTVLAGALKVFNPAFRALLLGMAGPQMLSAATAAGGLGVSLAGVASGLLLLTGAVGAWYLAYERTKDAWNDYTSRSAANKASLDSVTAASGPQARFDALGFARKLPASLQAHYDEDHAANGRRGHIAGGTARGPIDLVPAANLVPGPAITVHTTNNIVLGGKVLQAVKTTVVTGMTQALTSTAGPTSGDPRAVPMPAGANAQ